MADEKKFEAHAIVELFGHQSVAGRISEQAIGGCSFVRIDIPETRKAPAFTRLFGNGAIYSITITDEKTAKMYAENHTPEPMDRWTVQHYIEQLDSAKTAGKELQGPGEEE